MQFIEFLKSVPIIVWYGLSLITVLIGDFAAKQWSINFRWGTVAIVAVAYMLAGIFYLPTLLKDGLIVTATTWMVLNIAGFVIIGFLIFHEKLTTAQIIGLVFALIAVILINFGDH